MTAMLSLLAVLLAVGPSPTGLGNHTHKQVKQVPPHGAATGAPSSVLDFTVQDIDGRTVNLQQYRGKVLLVVNVASHCGFTPQYTGLEALYQKYQDRGLEVLAFPANDFKSQEPGTNAEIKQFCTTNYAVTFPLFSKIVVKGAGQHPLYQFLTEKATDPAFAGDIRWNFTKFVIGRDGTIRARFDSKVPPDNPELVSAVEQALGK